MLNALNRSDVSLRGNLWAEQAATKSGSIMPELADNLLWAFQALGAGDASDRSKGLLSGRRPFRVLLSHLWSCLPKSFADMEDKMQQHEQIACQTNSTLCVDGTAHAEEHMLP